METGQAHQSAVRQGLPPTVIAIFGITGNLSRSKLLPALYHLLKKDLLPEQCEVVGVFRPSSMTMDSLMQQVEINLLREHQDVDAKVLERLKNMIHPITMDSTDHKDYTRLAGLLNKLDEDHNVHYQRLFYLAIPPSIFYEVMDCLERAGLNTEPDGLARRILVEKPFGTNFASAKELVDIMSEKFDEHQIYRIDHYLAKENAQNIIVFRFSNPFVENIWSRQFIDHIQITVSENIGIDARSNFYEGMGALRDIVQSHMMQLMALVMMDKPETMTSRDIHRQKLALLSAIQPFRQTNVGELTVRGQYEGYREEVQNQSSTTETFAALHLNVANQRWEGVPVLLRTGKALRKRLTEINVVFKDKNSKDIPPNVLTIRIQPDEGIGIRLTAKKPGFSNELESVDMQFTYQNSFAGDSPDAYERVLVDSIASDQSLFASSDEVLRCWEILEPILNHWAHHPDQPLIYPRGSSGPAEVDQLAEKFNAEWL